jgi:hypothetical protein
MAPHGIQGIQGEGQPCEGFVPSWKEMLLAVFAETLGLYVYLFT